MPTKRIFAAAALAGALLTSLPLFAEPLTTPATTPASSTVAPNLMGQLAVFSPAAMLAQSAAPAVAKAAAADKSAGWGDDDDADSADMPNSGVSNNAVAALANDTSDLRKTLISLAMQLRDIRYVRGGRDPSTGFDCSGFVRYVFAHAVGLELPTNSASQFLAGLKVNRGDMKPGDLVFFRTAGKRGQGRISHVGIYIANGQFIHSPSRGKTVRVDSLDESYWAQRFAGAKRPGALARS
ncbi:Cell wall-associated hydrolase, NlpC family [Dyella jiangningensis]|uniref:C40 family peptidase n=1 Tax=Dyella sp. AtDHG13 TaxID=1938897 RepID=UPI000888DAE5|nr:C40 family peptidase [Dyella sp. AtDHG13]PXV58332.1 cell wall-associated NlpC family hydrolase [Dyella sp. AtDHG13]SDK06829.1 Cell wall-associated hydrolase, NlpC family [Dyella jiangningensis]